MLEQFQSISQNFHTSPTNLQICVVQRSNEQPQASVNISHAKVQVHGITGANS